MSGAGGLSRTWTIPYLVIRALVGIPFLMAAWLEGMSSPQTLAALDLVWLPDAPLWLVRLVAGIEGLAALGLILPSLMRLPPVVVAVSAFVLLLVQIAALGFDRSAGSLGDLPAKAIVLGLTLIILLAELGRPSSETSPP